MQQQTIKISGMSCSGCADMIAENISQLEGVKNVKVSLDDNSASVTYNAELTTTEDFKETIETTGYGFEGMNRQFSSLVRLQTQKPDEE